MRTRILAILFLLLLGFQSKAQDNGLLTGSFESNTHYYFNDNLLGILAPQNRLASNNYMMLKYNLGSFSAGIQYEAYMPPLSGYPYQLEGMRITSRYLKFTRGIIDITAGNFYEQFGNGFSFRSYEDRYLGINNSMDGVRVAIKPIDGIYIKGIYGKQRKFLVYADSYIRGLDGEFSLAPILNWNNNITLGGGITSKYEPYTGPGDSFPVVVNAINTRLGVDYMGFSYYSELVFKSDDSPDPIFLGKTPGRTVYANLSYTGPGIGAFVSARFLDNMTFMNEIYSEDNFSDINYLPANSRQHSYSLTNLYPYPTQPDSEGSFQVDLNYNLPRNSRLGGKYGTGLRANYSISRSLIKKDNGDTQIFSFGNRLYYQDINFEINRRWSRDFKSIVLFQHIAYNKDAIDFGGYKLIYAKVLVADLRYNLTRRISLKAELQHLWSDNDHGNWFAWRAELSYSPLIALYIYDLTDYEYDPQVHYLNGGISLNFDFLRLSIGYGRSREGYICSGGVCRKVPAYRGLTLTLNSSF